MVQYAAPGYEKKLDASRAYRVTDRKGPARAAAARQADLDLAQTLSATADNVLAGLTRSEYRERARFATIPFVSLELTEQGLNQLLDLPGVLGVYWDRPEPLPVPAPTRTNEVPDQPTLTATVDIIGADHVWSRGYTGSGWYVAILDTGILRTHEFFAGKTIVEACFASGEDGSGADSTGDCPNGNNSQTGTGSAAPHPSLYVGYDHGTHVAGIAAGHKADETLHGVAKDAGIIAIQVFSRFPSEIEVGSWPSDQILGLEYIYALRSTYNIGAVNMSLGGDRYYDQSTCDSDGSARKTIIDSLRAVNIATIIASGNNGYCDSLGIPGCISSAVAIGATTDADVETSFNNYHPTMMDIFAPGYAVYSSVASSDTAYASKNGTSMATPHVTGAWTLLRQAKPTASVTQILSAVLGTGVTVVSPCDGGSKPRIQVNSALACLIGGGCPVGSIINLMLQQP